MLMKAWVLLIHTLGWSLVGTEVRTVTLMGLSLVTSQNFLPPEDSSRWPSLPPLSTRSISNSQIEAKKKQELNR